MGQKQTMAIKTRVALDTMCFIYYFEKIDPYFAPLKKIILDSQNNKSEIITSIISLLETLSSSKFLQKNELISELTQFFKESGFIKVYAVDWEIADKSAELRRNFPSLRTPDSIQLATAVINHASIFVTNDDYLSKLPIPYLKILTPKDL